MSRTTNSYCDNQKWNLGRLSIETQKDNVKTPHQNLNNYFRVEYFFNAEFSGGIWKVLCIQISWQIYWSSSTVYSNVGAVFLNLIIIFLQHIFLKSKEVHISFGSLFCWYYPVPTIHVGRNVECGLTKVDDIIISLPQKLL